MKCPLKRTNCEMNRHFLDKYAKLYAVAALAGLLMGFPTVGSASLWTFSDTADGYSASADFEPIVGGMQIILTNTDPGVTFDQAHILTGVAFDASGSGSNSDGSASIGPSSLLYITSGAVLGTSGSNVNVGWGFGGVSGAASLGGGTAGVSASGVFGFNTAFDMSSALQGSDFGLLSKANTAVFTTPPYDGLTSHNPYVQNSVVIDLFGTFDASTVSHVGFQWGTSTDGEFSTTGIPGGPPPVGSVPEPTSVAVWGIVSGLAAGAVAWRKPRRNRSTGRWSNENRAAIYKVVGGRTMI